MQSLLLHEKEGLHRFPMGRKLCLPSLFFFRPRDSPRTPSSSSPSPSSSSSPSSWGWPSCKQPKTHSFRAGGASDEIYKTVNSIYFDSPESLFTFSEEETHSFSTTSASGEFAGESSSSVRRRRSDRLFFEPGEASSSSIMEECKAGRAPFKQSIVMALESEDPCRDFGVSMKEMVVAHGLAGWEPLLQLLVWYLRANRKETHGFIFGAFLDLVAGLAASAAAASSSSSSLGAISLEIEELPEESESC